MRSWVQWHPIFIASDHGATLLHSLLRGVVVLLTQPLPVLPAPEKLLRLHYCLAVTRAQSLFQFVRDDVVNHRCRCHPALILAHDTQGVRTKEDKTFTVPLAAVYAWLFVHVKLFQVLMRYYKKTRRSGLIILYCDSRVDFSLSFSSYTQSRTRTR